VIGEVSGGVEAVEKAQELKPDLILMDIGLLGLNGIEAARRIRKLVPASKIVFLTQESSPEVIEEAITLAHPGTFSDRRQKLIFGRRWKLFCRARNVLTVAPLTRMTIRVQSGPCP
jgi:DNA-binding NarL/FixJ family response regulator